jgi:hypothetical protein
LFTENFLVEGDKAGIPDPGPGGQMTQPVAAKGYRKLAKALLPLGLLLVLAACTTPFRAQVSRFQVMPAPADQSFVIEPAGNIPPGSLEFRTYAAHVEAELRRAGFMPAPDRSAATLVVRFDYGLGPARERVDTRPGWGAAGWGPGWGPGWGRWGGWYGGWGGWGGGWGGWGWGGWGNEVYSYTVFPSFASVSIVRTADGIGLFEGRAEATSRKGDLPYLVPRLVTALFTGFPGNSGETIVVKVPEPAK